MPWSVEKLPKKPLGTTENFWKVSKNLFLNQFLQNLFLNQFLRSAFVECWVDQSNFIGDYQDHIWIKWYQVTVSVSWIANQISNLCKLGYLYTAFYEVLSMTQIEKLPSYNLYYQALFFENSLGILYLFPSGMDILLSFKALPIMAKFFLPLKTEKGVGTGQCAFYC